MLFGWMRVGEDMRVVGEKGGRGRREWWTKNGGRLEGKKGESGGPARVAWRFGELGKCHWVFVDLSLLLNKVVGAAGDGDQFEKKEGLGVSVRVGIIVLGVGYDGLF